MFFYRRRISLSCFGTSYVCIKPAAYNLQNSCDHVSWLSYEKKVHTWELPTHASQFLLFSRVIVREVISSTSSRDNPFVICKVTLLLRNNTKHEKPVLWSHTKEYEKPLRVLRVSQNTKHEKSALWSNAKEREKPQRTLCVSHINLCYERVLWLSYKSFVVSIMISVTRIVLLLRSQGMVGLD